MQFLYYLQQQWTGSEPQSIHFFRRPLTCKALNQYLRVVKPESVPCHWATGGWGREVQQQRGARTYCGTSLKLPSNSYSSSAGDSRVDRTVPSGPTAFLSTYSMFRTPKLCENPSKSGYLCVMRSDNCLLNKADESLEWDWKREHNRGDAMCPFSAPHFLDVRGLIDVLHGYTSKLCMLSLLFICACVCEREIERETHTQQTEEMEKENYVTTWM